MSEAQRHQIAERWLLQISGPKQPNYAAGAVVDIPDVAFLCMGLSAGSCYQILIDVKQQDLTLCAASKKTQMIL